MGCLSQIVLHRACVLLHAPLLFGYPRRHHVVSEVSHRRSDLILLCGTCGRAQAWKVLYEDALDVILELWVGQWQRRHGLQHRDVSISLGHGQGTAEKIEEGLA